MPLPSRRAFLGAAFGALTAPLSIVAQSGRYSVTKRFRFTDLNEIQKDWKILGEKRIEGQGLRLYDKASEIEALYLLRGDCEITVEFEASSRRELCIDLWGESFEFKPDLPKTPRGDIPGVALLIRKGNEVQYRTGSIPFLTVKLDEGQRNKPTSLVLHMDRKSSSKVNRELLIKSVNIRAVVMQRVPASTTPPPASTPVKQPPG